MWIACSGASLRQAMSPEFIQLLAFSNARLERLLINSDTTAGAWLKQSFNEHQALVKRSLAATNSGFTISFDAWKTNNEVLDLLGVVIHYIDETYRLRNIVIGLRNTMGDHTGANQAEHLFSVLHPYGIGGSQISYFIADTVLKALLHKH